MADDVGRNRQPRPVSQESHNVSAKRCLSSDVLSLLQRPTSTPTTLNVPGSPKSRLASDHLRALISVVSTGSSTRIERQAVGVTSQMSIDDYFLGYNDSRVTRRYVFTDRTSEQEALLDPARAMAAVRYDTAALTDYRHQVTNLSVVFGEGGIGKTALIREVGQAFIGKAPRNERAVAYVDLGDFANHNFEIVLIKIRSAFGKLAHQWPAFDLAFATYWSRKHPGTNLLRFLDHAGFLGEEERRALIDQFTAILDVVLGGTGLISAGYRLSALLKQQIMESRKTKHLRSTYPPFAIILDEPEPDKVLGYLPSLLAFDLEQARRAKPTEALCLLDTFEYAQLSRGDKGSIEDLLSRLIYLMPNVPFIVASRLPLRWSDAAHVATLTYGGPDRWPSLIADGGGQFQIAGLDLASSDELLRDSLEVDGESAMPSAVRQRVIHGSHGLPLYLELSINWYRELMLKGHTPEPSEVAESFPELVFRIMRDLSSGERDLLRASSLMEAVSEEFLGVVVPSVRGTDLRHFLDRSFVERSPESWLPYSLHANLRRAIVEHDHLTDDAWTHEEWQERARIAVSWLEQQGLAVWESDVSRGSDPETAGRKSVAAVLLVSIAATEYEIEPSLLGELAFTVSQFGYRRVFASMPNTNTGDSKLGRLLSVAHILARTELTPAETYQLLVPYVTSDPTNGYDQFISAVFANIAETVGRFRQAERVYSSLASASPEIAYYARLGLAGNALRSGKLGEALAAAPRDDGPWVHGAAAHDLLGHIYLQGAEHAKAAEFFESAHSDSVKAGSPVWAARALRHVAGARMWFDPDGALKILPEARDMNEALGEQVGVAQCRLASALSWAWKGDLEKCEADLKWCKEVDLDKQAMGQPWMIEVLLSKARGDDTAAAAAAERVYATTDTDSRRPTVYLAVAALWADRADLADFDSIEWYDDRRLARARWLRPLERMRDIFSSSDKTP